MRVARDWKCVHPTPQTNGASKRVFCTALGVENRHHCGEHAPSPSHCRLPEMAESKEGGQSGLRSSVACCPARSREQRVKVFQGQGQRFTRGTAAASLRHPAAQGAPAELRPAQICIFPGPRATTHSYPSPPASSTLASAHYPLQAASQRLLSEQGDGGWGAETSRLWPSSPRLSFSLLPSTEERVRPPVIFGGLRLAAKGRDRSPG